MPRLRQLGAGPDGRRLSGRRSNEPGANGTRDQDRRSGRNSGAQPARFSRALEEASPDSILRIREPVALDYEMTAIAMELERRGQSPVLWFERVGDSPLPVVANVFGNRRRFAFAIGVPEGELLDAWGRLGDKLYQARDRVSAARSSTTCSPAPMSISAACLFRAISPRTAAPTSPTASWWPRIPTAACATPASTACRSRAPRLLGTSLHSRRHLWNYARRAEELGQRSAGDRHHRLSSAVDLRLGAVEGPDRHRRVRGGRRLPRRAAARWRSVPWARSKSRSSARSRSKAPS